MNNALKVHILNYRIDTRVGAQYLIRFDEGLIRPQMCVNKIVVACVK